MVESQRFGAFPWAIGGIGMSHRRIKPPKSLRLGATGEFPEGKCHPTDEGELRLGIVADHGSRLVRLEFGKPVAWTAMGPAMGRKFAALLVEKANELEPLT